MSSDETIHPKPKTWYTQHPLVSTFLWVLGNHGSSVSAENLQPMSQQNSNSRLHWKDELEGSSICEDMEAEQVDGTPPRRVVSATALKHSESGKHMGSFFVSVVLLVCCVKLCLTYV
jgi:hypothetical protein